jgi:hypothetical protein
MLSTVKWKQVMSEVINVQVCDATMTNRITKDDYQNKKLCNQIS